MDVEQVPEPEAHEVEVEPSEPVILKKRGRPKGSLNKKTIQNMRQDVLPESSILESEEGNMVLDVDFTSDEILGEKPRATPNPKRRKPKAAPKARDPPTEPPSEEEDESPPPPPPITRKRPPHVKTSDTYREPEQINPPTYLEVLARGLKEARAKQYAEKVAQYDRCFHW